MGTFILELAVTVTPLVVLTASVKIISSLSKKQVRHHLASHRAHRNMMRALAVCLPGNPWAERPSLRMTWRPG
jgi:hypothetical protein